MLQLAVDGVGKVQPCKKQDNSDQIRPDNIQYFIFRALYTLRRIQFVPVIKDQITGHNKIEGGKINAHVQYTYFFICKAAPEHQPPGQQIGSCCNHGVYNNMKPVQITLIILYHYGSSPFSKCSIQYLPTKHKDFYELRVGTETFVHPQSPLTRAETG